MNLKSVFTFISCSLTILSYAQHDSLTISSDTLIISGLVHDTSGKPIMDATVLLCNSDSSVVNTHQTDSIGAYQFKSSKVSNYLLIFQHLNYQRKLVPLSADVLRKLKGNLITILEKSKTIELQDVNIVARKNRGLEKTPEGFSFHVDEQLSKLTLWELLKRTPLLEARANGELSILGKSGVVVYINGRKSNLSGEALSEMLRNMSSENLKKIEIITSPSSKYEAQGNAGIINLELKKPTNEGLTGSVSLTNEFAYYNVHLANINLNYARGKVTSQLNLRGGRYANRIIESSDISLPTLNMRYNAILNRHDSSDPAGAAWITDIAFTDRHQLNVQVNASESRSKYNWYTVNQYGRLHSTKIDSTLISDNKQKEGRSVFSIDINDQIKFDTLGSYLSAGVSFFTQRSDNNSPYDIIQPSKQYSFETNYLQKFKNYAAQFDYHKVFKPAISLDAGVRVNRNVSLNQNTFSHNIRGDFVHDRSKENNFDYRETIYALYTSLSWKIGEKLNTLLGARLEQTDINGYEAVRADSVVRKYTNLFPNISIAYDINKSNKLGLSVNSRINRPSFWELNPTPLYLSPTRYVKGNAFLMPARSLNFELSYMFRQKVTFLTGYNHINNSWTQFQITKKNSDTIAFDRLNYGNLDQAVMAINYNNQFFNERLRIGANVTANYNRYSGAIPARKIEQQTWKLTGRFRADVNLDKKEKYSLYLSYYYSSPWRSARGKIFGWQMFETGGQLKIKNVVVQVSGEDIFNQGLFRSTFDNEGISDTYEEEHNSLRRLVVRVSYNFGKTNIRKAKSGGAANEEQKGRVQ